MADVLSPLQVLLNSGRMDILKPDLFLQYPLKNRVSRDFDNFPALMISPLSCCICELTSPVQSHVPCPGRTSPLVYTESMGSVLQCPDSIGLYA